jgi:hypothetical protein
MWFGGEGAEERGCEIGHVFIAPGFGVRGTGGVCN